MQDQPASSELSQTVADFLRQEVQLAISDPILRFRLLIAANVLSIVSRELEAGEGPLLAEWQRLAELLRLADPLPQRAASLRQAVEAMSRQLCAGIRAGKFDEGRAYTAAYEHAWATVVEKLEITNPRYLENILNAA